MQKILDFFRVLCSYVPGDNLIWKEIKEKNKKLENFVENKNKLWVLRTKLSMEEIINFWVYVTPNYDSFHN